MRLLRSALVLALLLVVIGAAPGAVLALTPTPTTQPYPTSTRTPGPWRCDLDGVIEPENDEVCDDGNDVDGDGCDNNCTPTGCGNGILTAGETCDDGNRAACDGCSATCQGEPGFPCGNGVLDPACGEQCDDGNTGSCDGCSADCRIEANVCGDGNRNPECEECDDGNRSDADACRNDCRPNVCPDGFVNPTAEQCDDGNGDDFDGCTNACTVCANGVVTPPEQCDDGNRVNEDACRNDCQPNVCGDGVPNPLAETCDDGNTRSGDGCDANCTPTGCGNGIATAGEACDDGDLVDGDGCDSNCRPTACGNGVVTAGEECDDGNRNPFDGCTRTCTICGDGRTIAPEECDDGNLEPSDGCTNACTICGNHIVTPPESCDDGNLVDGDGCYAYCATPGCGNNVREGDEECDDGGRCIGGGNAGDVCTGPGGCLSGVCEPAGGDGCAVNCSVETAQRFMVDPARSFVSIQNQAIHIGLPLSGELTLRTGRPRASEQTGDVPVAIGAGDVRLAPLPMPLPVFSTGCLCLRGRDGMPAGSPVAGTGTVACGAEGLGGIDLLTSIDHDTTDVDPSCANGTIEEGGACADGRCASGPYAGELCRVDIDCGSSDRHPGVCNGGETVTASGNGPPGSGLIAFQLLAQQIGGDRGCAVETDTQVCRDGECAPAKGANGIPCDADDPLPGDVAHYSGEPFVFVPLYAGARLTTGRAGAEVVDANDHLGTDIRAGVNCRGRECVAEASGSPFECSASGIFAGATLAAAFPALDLDGFGDTVITLALALEPGVHVVGNGTPESCTEAALDAALVVAGEVAFDCGSEPVTITITSTKIIARDTTIDGGGLITISGGGQVGVFAVSSGVTAGIRDLTIADGKARAGGGVRNEGTLVITDSVITRNTAEMGVTQSFGGGLFNTGTLTVMRCTLGDNVSGGGAGGSISNNRGVVTVIDSAFVRNRGDGGGGIYNEGALSVTGSTFAENGAGFGGGILNIGDATATVSNSTFSDNAAEGLDTSAGGGVLNALGGTLTVTNSTFSRNSTAIDSVGMLTLTNTLIANSTDGRDCSNNGQFADGGHNLIEDAEDSCGLVDGVDGNLVGVDPLLDPAGLADHGGPTETIALLSGSPVIDAGDPVACADPPVNGLDQRGFVRPGTGSANCSIGAYEYDSPGPPVSCIGDCNGTGRVTIAELITMVDIALGGAEVSACARGDANGDGAITIDELVRAVHSALAGCPPPAGRSP